MPIETLVAHLNQSDYNKKILKLKTKPKLPNKQVTQTTMHKGRVSTKCGTNSYTHKIDWGATDIIVEMPKILKY